MRQTGYYFVEYNGKTEIAKWMGSTWRRIGSTNSFNDYNFTHISPTPITPEKMAAIDEIVAMCDDQALPLEIVQRISKILAKHRLLPPSARP